MGNRLLLGSASLDRILLALAWRSLKSGSVKIRDIFCRLTSWGQWRGRGGGGYAFVGWDVQRCQWQRTLSSLPVSWIQAQRHDQNRACTQPQTTAWQITQSQALLEASQKTRKDGTGGWCSLRWRERGYPTDWQRGSKQEGEPASVAGRYCGAIDVDYEPRTQASWE